jgi:hypothetical protein
VAELLVEDASETALFYQGGRFAAAGHVGGLRKR